MPGAPMVSMKSSPVVTVEGLTSVSVAVIRTDGVRRVDAERAVVRGRVDRDRARDRSGQVDRQGRRRGRAPGAGR